MCNYKSGIICRDGRIFIEQDTDSHTELISRHKLREGSESSPWANFVSVECVPNPKADMFSLNRRNWKFRLDDESNVPEWFQENKADLEDKFFIRLFEVVVEILNEIESSG